MKIYTKTGDKGKTSLFDGTRVYKNNLRVETYGVIDELNAVLGIVVSFFEKKEYHEQLQGKIVIIQNDLFEIGARLANPQVPKNLKLMSQLHEHTEQLEGYIDSLTIQMPELTYFILPGGGTIGAFLQLARTVSRRAERHIVTLSQKEVIEKEILIYINRLSDVFHTMSRYANFKENKKETMWISKTR
ncbi:MAG TPA: cob(I)yrinic acid a,c-diamide adenosyltransferase [Candidatus Saccharimonadales bacterium]|nr:cob(I)yrinic acid a,c-diamide adenosyltransferase [Candidatus Saccharimonadales bacterium]